MKLLNEILKMISCAFIGGCVAMALVANGIFAVSHGTNVGKNISFSELASINLTVATIVLASVALIVGIGAILGYQSIRSSSVQSSIEASVLASVERSVMVSKLQVEELLPKLIKVELPCSLRVELPLQIDEPLKMHLKEALSEMRKSGVFQKEFAMAVFGPTEKDNDFDEE